MNNTKKGMFCILCAAFFFASMNVCVKLAGNLPSIQKSFFRNLIAALFALIILLKNKEEISYQKKDFPMLLVRSVFGTIGIYVISMRSTIYLFQMLRCLTNFHLSL